MWIDERDRFLVECDHCMTFTITQKRRTVFIDAWRLDDRETFMRLESLSRYLRLAGDDCDRDVTAESWVTLALEGEHMDGDSQ
jgi:hypothetical protein